MAHDPQSAGAGPRTVPIDLAVALLILVLGALVAWDSYRLGSEWGSDGPQAGYFPYYIGLITCICSVVVFVQGLLKLKSDRSMFVTWEQLKQVMVILLPSTLYVAGVQWIGIYVSSLVFILLFMKIAGKYSWLRSVFVSALVSVTSFVLFEIWFKIPLPKGPVERLIGF